MMHPISKIACLLFFSWSAYSISAQDTCIFLFILPQNASFVTADHLSNTYLVKGFELEKYDSTGRLVTQYSNNRLGRVGFVDASNPLKILVWYADFQTAVFLDRNLTELGRLNLAEAGYPAVRCLASAADGNLWAYDESTAQLMKLSTAGEKRLESQPLNLAFKYRFSPTCIRDDGGESVYLSDPRQGVAVFDIFAQLDKALPMKGLVQFEVSNGNLYYIETEGIRVENWRRLSAHTMKLPWTEEAGVTGFWLSKGRLFAQSPFGVSVWLVSG